MSYKDSEAKKNNKTAELLSQAEEGIKEVLSSDKYKNFLRVMSKFHNYSLNNTLLTELGRSRPSSIGG
ncbi:hypothetical protein [Enterococcus faecium]|uniref:hypothetical protein n=1 Tax=Enterococcus faecium TaxID=1352 RepID=UPI000DE88471|nr:hypothetical protein [Enterococcus faecium]EGP5273786.1 hypothetical protein [Enterococcus faecium]RBT11065.1 hypothetical protein EA93_02561 [Enterococcus faecium]